MRKPVITLDEYELQHRELDDTLRRYRVSKMGRDVFGPLVKKYLSLRHAESLKAINCASRIALVKALVNGVTNILERDSVDTAFFITLISRDFAFPIGRAKAFRPAQRKSWVTDIIGNIDYIGFWEAAYYYRSPFLQAGHRPHVVWHAHLIAWNVEEADIVQLRDQTNARECAFVPGRDAFHYRRLAKRRVSGRVVYMAKGCLSEYTAYPLSKDVSDPDTGEVFNVPGDRWMNRKRPIRPGSLAKATNAVGLRSLRSLCLAGGAGKRVKRNALKESRRNLKTERLLREQSIKEAVMGVDEG